MAYGLKYELLCTTKQSNLYKAKVYFDDYAGAEVDRNLPVNPFNLRKDRAAIVRGTSFEFSMREETDFEYLEFYTNVPKHIKVELLDPSDVQLWVGYLDTQQYSCPYIPAPLTVTFTASDGLGLLKNEAFTLTGTQTQFAILKHCLDKIALDLGYAVAISVHELRHNTAISPLEQTTEPCSAFEDLNCYEVIEKILNKYDAEIYQWKGRWRIICSNDKKSTRLLYNSAGTYTGTEAAPVVLDLDYPGTGIEVTPVGQLNMSLEPGGKQVHVVHEYGRKDSLLENYNFEDYDIAASGFTSWNQSGSFAVTQGDLNGMNFAFLEGTSTVNGDGISQSVNYYNGGGESFVFEVDYCAIGYLQGTYKRVIAMTVRYQLMLTNGISSYWLNELEEGYGEWTTTPTINSHLNNASREVPQFNHIKVETATPPINGFLSLDLYRHYGAEPGPNYHYVGVCWSRPVLNIIGGTTDAAGTRYEATAVFDNSSEIINLPDVSILNADAPVDVYNRATLYKNITFLEADGATTWLWNIDGVTGDYSIIEVMFKLLASRNRVSRQVLQGTIKGTTIALDSIIKHGYNSNREFEIAECSWDIYEEKVNGKFLEILAWSDEAVTITLGAKVPASNSSSSGGSSGGLIVQMTPDQILAALVTVDGAGSNLDADTLDGYHAASFALTGHNHPDVEDLQDVFEDSFEPTGFVDRGDSIIGFTTGSQEFVIAAMSAEYKFYSAGTPYTKYDDITVTGISDVGLNYIYFDSLGEIQKSTIPWDINSANVPVATVYWNGSDGLLADERHGIQMDGQTHEYLHETRGAAYAFGLTGVFAANGSTISIGAGEWYDEDIEWANLSAYTQCRVFWRIGSAWNWTAAQNAFFHAVSSVPQYNNSGSLAGVGVAKYSMSWIFITNNTATPVAVIMGQGEYNTQAQLKLLYLLRLHWASLTGS